MCGHVFQCVLSEHLFLHGGERVHGGRARGERGGGGERTLWLYVRFVYKIIDLSRSGFNFDFQTSLYHLPV